jgi:Double-stranded RNA binding motif
MSKAKLHEYCQKYRLQNPQYFTTNVPPLFTSIVILGVGLSKPQEFLSRESHSTKKKAENDAAEVALNAIEKFDGDLFDNPALVKPTLRTDDLVSSIWKAVEASNTGIFSDKIWVPVEYLLLFSGVRSALNRIDQKHKWDTSSAFDCLLEALFTKKQNFLQVQTRNTQVLICKVAEFTPESAEQSQQVLKHSCVTHDQATSTSFIVLPASEVRAPFEVNITFISESNEGSNDVQRMVKMFDMMSAQLNIAGNLAISRPLFITAEQRGDGKQVSSSPSVLLSAPDDLEVRPVAGQKATVGQPRLFMQHQDIRGQLRLCFIILYVIYVLHLCSSNVSFDGK